MTKVMGVVNVTPDSFSDGGRWFAPDIAIAHGHQLIAQGADLIDVGGESTRPGALRVSDDVETQRVIPVVEALAAGGATVTIDTMRSSVASAALAAGAWGINDVSGGLADSSMLTVAAEHGCDLVLGHWRGHSDVMDSLADYDDVVAQVRSELLARVDEAVSRGVHADRIILDPGLGFAKNAADNWRLLAQVEALKASGMRILIGASRKRFLGDLLAQDGLPALPAYRDAATAAVSALMAAQGVWAVRVHEVSASVDAVKVANAVQVAGLEPPRHAEI